MNRTILAGIALLGAALQAVAAGPAEVIARVKSEVAPDLRQAVWEVRAVDTDGGGVAVVGVVSEASMKEALAAALAEAGIAASVDGVAVLPGDRFALVSIPVASIRTGGRHASEMATQAVMGMPVRVLEESGEFLRVMTPDGYIGYVPGSSIARKSIDEMAAWRRAGRVVVTARDQVDVYSTPKPAGVRDIVTDVVNGSILEGDYGVKGKMMAVTLPDGRRGWIARENVTPIETWASQEFAPDVILDMAYSLQGTPYLWGGTSAKTLDCSGLVKVCYLANGIILMRDASQQATIGTVMEPERWRELQPADLLFFGNPTTGKVTHVAIYDRDGRYIHSSGRVKVNAIDPALDDYLTSPHLSSTRIDGNQGTRGIVRAIDHPWLFDRER